MLRKTAWLVALCAGLALGVTPALAADMPPHKPMPMKHGQMHARRHHKTSCYDYAWQSQAMKDCLARPATMATPMHHPMHRKMMKKPMEN
jgi:hypothetical protein